MNAYGFLYDTFTHIDQIYLIGLLDGTIVWLSNSSKMPLKDMDPINEHIYWDAVTINILIETDWMQDHAFILWWHMHISFSRTLQYLDGWFYEE